jgi:lipoprotein NlpI
MRDDFPLPSETNASAVPRQCRTAIGDFEGAVRDYEQAMAADAKNPYLIIHQAVLLLRLNRSGATEPLAQATARWNEGWEKTVGRFLLGERKEQELLTAANQGLPQVLNRQHCEANYYAGMKRLLEGKADAAKDFFAKSIATQQTDFVEFQLAQAELNRLAATGGK